MPILCVCEFYMVFIILFIQLLILFFLIFLYCTKSLSESPLTLRLDIDQKRASSQNQFVRERPITIAYCYCKGIASSIINKLVKAPRIEEAHVFIIFVPGAHASAGVWRTCIV